LTGRYTLIVQPLTGDTGCPATLTMTGTALDPTDTVELSRTGSAPIRAVVKQTAPDRRTTTVQLTLPSPRAGGGT
jgi:hypothetical protein